MDTSQEVSKLGLHGSGLWPNADNGVCGDTLITIGTEEPGFRLTTNTMETVGKSDLFLHSSAKLFPSLNARLKFIISHIFLFLRFDIFQKN